MTTFTLFFSLFAMLSVHPTLAAQGDPAIEPVSSNQLRLIGRGIQQRGSTQSLALACYSSPESEAQDCHQARFVLFIDARTAGYIGPTLQVPQAPNLDLQKRADRVWLKDFFQNHESEFSAKRRTRMRIGALFVATGILAGVAISGGSLGVVGGIAVFNGMPLALLFSADAGQYFVGTASQVSFNDQTGWNWSSRPKHVSQKMFANLVTEIVSAPLSQSQLWKRQQYDLVDREQKIIRKKERLSKAGVRF